jgi:hypothetical protein
MMNAVWRASSLWGTLTGTDATDARDVVRWYQVGTAGFPPGAPSLVQEGTIDGGTDTFTYMPSIAVDSCGNAAVTYTQSSSSSFPLMRYTGRASGDALGLMQSPVTAKASTFFYDDFTGPPERWGDYSATVIDPSDQAFWVANEYARVAASGAGNDGRWGTWIGRFTFGCGPPPTATPTPTRTRTPTRTPTSTPKNPNGDTDKDFIVNSIDTDDDNDGCSDTKENQTAVGSQTTGGRRNPHSFWDFYDTPNTSNVRDHVINVLDDIIGVARRFGALRGSVPTKQQAYLEAIVAPVGLTGYHAAFDRGALVGPLPWNLGPADGAINVLDDIVGVANQFGHDCT